MNKKEKRTGVITPVEKHLARGYCCGSGCKMCPYAPETYQRNNTNKSIICSHDKTQIPIHKSLTTFMVEKSLVNEPSRVTLHRIVQYITKKIKYLLQKQKQLTLITIIVGKTNSQIDEYKQKPFPNRTVTGPSQLPPRETLESPYIRTLYSTLIIYHTYTLD